MYAVIETGGKQYRVSEGDILFVEKLNAEENTDITFDKVIAVGKEDGAVIGTPTVEGVTVFTYRAKKGSKRKMGHRQPYSKVQIMNINA